MKVNSLPAEGTAVRPFGEATKDQGIVGEVVRLQ